MKPVSLLPRAPFHVIRAQHEFLRDNRRHEAERDQAVRLRIRKTAEQDAINHAEDGGTCDRDVVWPSFEVSTRRLAVV